MQILRKFQDDFSRQKDFRAVDVHRIVEALKFGFVKRWEYDTAIDEEVSIKRKITKFHVIKFLPSDFEHTIFPRIWQKYISNHRRL